MKLRPVRQELLGIQEDTAQCGSRITRHSRGPKRTPCKAGGIKISNFPGIQQRRGSPLLKTKPRNKAQRICARSYAKLDRGPCIIILEIWLCCGVSHERNLSERYELKEAPTMTLVRQSSLVRYMSIRWGSQELPYIKIFIEAPRCYPIRSKAVNHNAL